MTTLRATDQPVRADALSGPPGDRPAVAPESAAADMAVDAAQTEQDGEGSELASTTMAEVVSPAEDTEVPATEPSCALIGPMTSEAADALIRQLPAFLELLSDVTVEAREVDGYYVMIPPLPSRAAGLAMLDRLAAEGITDTWLFRGGVYRNAISLGLYSRKNGAERHLRRVNQTGFEAVLVEKESRQERRQLLVMNVDGGDVALSLPLPEGVEAEQRPCP
jgi:hypothetical protein